MVGRLLVQLGLDSLVQVTVDNSGLLAGQDLAVLSENSIRPGFAFYDRIVAS